LLFHDVTTDVSGFSKFSTSTRAAQRAGLVVVVFEMAVERDRYGHPLRALRVT
jgi:selenophosphate synthase